MEWYVPESINVVNLLNVEAELTPTTLMPKKFLASISNFMFMSMIFSGAVTAKRVVTAMVQWEFNELEAATETLGLVLRGVTVEVMKENEKEWCEWYGKEMM